MEGVAERVWLVWRAAVVLGETDPGAVVGQAVASWCRWSLRTDESQVLWTGKGSFEIVVLGCG
jgi:hypothetical protein